MTLFAVFQPASGFEKNNAQPAFRWVEGSPGCTFSRDRDGKYRYGLWTPDYGVTLAVDAQKLMLVRKRAERFFAVQVTLKYRGHSTLDFDPGQATLEFVKHSKVVQPSLDPHSFVQRIQADLDQLEQDTQREVARHPDRKEEREKYVQAYHHDALELMDFVGRHTLSPGRLDSANPEASGWILFSTKNKWIGDWKHPEEFVLRLPVGGQVVEFPFLLPPNQGDLILRQRTDLHNRRASRPERVSPGDDNSLRSPSSFDCRGKIEPLVWFGTQTAGFPVLEMVSLSQLLVAANPVCSRN